jgi:hypothetical protein
MDAGGFDRFLSQFLIQWQETSITGLRDNTHELNQKITKLSTSADTTNKKLTALMMAARLPGWCRAQRSLSGLILTQMLSFGVVSFIPSRGWVECS